MGNKMDVKKYKKKDKRTAGEKSNRKIKGKSW
jgi:hypothetical protein